MALPVILVDSSTGSDSAASGAGPSTALTGSSASTDGGGTTVTLDGSPDLTNVATDGSHVIYLADSTAGARNFGKITGKDNSAKTVTVADAFGTSLSGLSWAIGGKRASIAGTASKKLFDNNSAAGDAMPGWVVEMQSGHVETIAATFNFWRSGDTTSGPVTLRGASGAATLPVLTFSNNGVMLAQYNDSLVLRDFELRNSNATKTASAAVSRAANGSYLQCDGLRIDHATDRVWKAIAGDWTNLSVRNCTIGNCASVGIDLEGHSTLRILNNWVYSCGGHGINLQGTGYYGAAIIGNIFHGNSGDGIRIGLGSNTPADYAGVFLWGNTCNANSGDGIEIEGANRDYSNALTCANNILSNNGAYGLNCSHGSASQALYDAVATLFFGNATYNNTSGAVNPAALTIGEGATSDPSYVDAAGGNFSLGTNLKGLGYPLGGTLPIGKYSATNSYVDPGAAQRQESGSGGGIIRAMPLTGGLV